VFLVKRHASAHAEKTSLDLLEAENFLLRDLFEQLDIHRGPSIEDRYDHGNLAKLIIRHLAIRQSSLMNVASAISPILSLRSTSARMLNGGTDRRRAYDDIGDLAREVPVMSLNQGQDFDGPLLSLIDAVAPELDWELTEAIPFIRGSLSTEDVATLFRSARYAKRHAPTKLRIKGPRWYERAPIISRLVTVYDHLKDFPASNHDKPRA
jgi:hypothetical protein